jgi:ribosome-associated translation inhibitor RaiA
MPLNFGEGEEADRFTIAFHNATASDAVFLRAKQLLSRLVRRNPLIMHGAMTIEGRHRHHHQGNLFQVLLRIHLPGGEVYVSHDPELNHAHEDVYVALRDACDAAHKQLKRFAKKGIQGEGLRHQQARFDGNPRNSA